LADPEVRSPPAQVCQGETRISANSRIIVFDGELLLTQSGIRIAAVDIGHDKFRIQPDSFIGVFKGKLILAELKVNIPSIGVGQD